MAHPTTSGNNPITAANYYDSWTEGSSTGTNGNSYENDFFKFGYVLL